MLLENLQTRTGAASMTEVIRRAVALYDSVSREIANGGELYLRRPHKSEVKVEII